MHQGKTAGELSIKASSDSTAYNALETGHALTEDIAKELAICARRHAAIFDEEEYCVGYVIAGDPLLHNLMRRKFFAMLYLPSPRPNQTVFLYNKRWERFTKRLWTLPNAATMAELSEMPLVDSKYQLMKKWSDWFFKPNFWQNIRDQHKISMPSEREYLKANREKLVEAGCKESESIRPQPFDFSKITGNKVVHALTPVLDQR